MRKLMLRALAFAALSGALFAQNITGTWQGTLKVGPQELRVVFKIALNDDKLAATFYSIDQQSPAIPANSITRDGSAVKIGITALNGTFEGRLSTDLTSIAGTWNQGMPVPLTLVRATPETAWTIPDPPPPPRIMAADAKPVFEVATIKPSEPGAQGIGINIDRSNRFLTHNTTLRDLLTFAYGIHPKQISGAPAWYENDHYDITAKADVEGQPNDKQLRGAMQKLLEDRFGLKFHREKKELAAYVLTVGKGGPKLTESKNNPNGLPGFGFGGRLGNLRVGNATMEELAGFLQSFPVLEQPVVDQTELTKRYDFTLNWSPDGSQFGGRAAQAPPLPDGVEAPPDLFTAIQQQLGLKLESKKAPVDVLVFDKVEKPSEN